MYLVRHRPSSPLSPFCYFFSFREQNGHCPLPEVQWIMRCQCTPVSYRLGSVLFVPFVPWESVKSRPQPGVLPAMDGSMYIESNHLSFISYNDSCLTKPCLFRPWPHQIRVYNLLMTGNVRNIPGFVSKTFQERQQTKKLPLLILYQQR